jgi:hypothetical protein
MDSVADPEAPRVSRHVELPVTAYLFEGNDRSLPPTVLAALTED